MEDEVGEVEEAAVGTEGRMTRNLGGRRKRGTRTHYGI